MLNSLVPLKRCIENKLGYNKLQNGLVFHSSQSYDFICRFLLGGNKTFLLYAMGNSCTILSEELSRP